PSVAVMRPAISVASHAVILSPARSTSSTTSGMNATRTVDQRFPTGSRDWVNIVFTQGRVRIGRHARRFYYGHRSPIFLSVTDPTAGVTILLIMKVLLRAAVVVGLTLGADVVLAQGGRTGQISSGSNSGITTARPGPGRPTPPTPGPGRPVNPPIVGPS